MQYLHIDPRIEKRLSVLLRSGKKGVLAAAKAENIISQLKAGGVIPDQVGSVTKHGELRIKGIMKYDLGSGYRLITFKRNHHLYLLYAGTHDECHRWIENNRELTVDQIRERCDMHLVHDIGDEGHGEQNLDPLEKDTIEPLSIISEKDLRRIFCGLVDQATLRP